MSNIKKPSVCLIGPGRIGMTLELDKLRKKPATHFGMWNSNKRSKFFLKTPSCCMLLVLLCFASGNCNPSM